MADSVSWGRAKVFDEHPEAVLEEQWLDDVLPMVAPWPSTGAG
jgi:hypothetical protein